MQYVYSDKSGRQYAEVLKVLDSAARQLFGENGFNAEPDQAPPFPVEVDLADGGRMVMFAFWVSRA
ncbi:hypothetical protein WDJ51_12085 [Rathayibacter sp. YIM 133350]|uniref:hypothetical protein n=1 Tax=Rathayibacter sp. YIM 133350 TaxID=3131992 RepID=UPI00307D13FE